MHSVPATPLARNLQFLASICCFIFLFHLVFCVAAVAGNEKLWYSHVKIRIIINCCTISELQMKFFSRMKYVLHLMRIFGMNNENRLMHSIFIKRTENYIYFPK